MIMDSFQGWYKDGTEGTQDYRSLSAVFMLLRIAIVCWFLIVIQLFLQKAVGTRCMVVTAVVHILIGIFHLTAKPYKRHWMNNVDGLLLILIGFLVILLISKYITW